MIWIVPVYVFTFTADLTRAFLEHSMEVPDAKADEAKRLISYESNFFERQFIAPMNMNFHAAHHLYPSIPYYNLPLVDRAMRASVYRDRGLIWRRSYVLYFLHYFYGLEWTGRSL